MVIYNAMSDEIVTLNPQLAEIYEQWRNTPENIQDLHPELFSYLIKKGVLVEDGIDEVNDYIIAKENEEKEMKEFAVTINPTLACNMKCWYCYETHKNMPAMNVNVKQAVIACIRKISDSRTIEKFNLSFFGGEPLLCFDKIVKDIIEEAVNVCNEHGIALFIHFTTNAYLLTERILKQMDGLNVSFQITIDGNENVHNTVRRTKNNETTYSTIIEHIRLASSMGFSVSVRFNYTAKSLPSFIDVLYDFQNLSNFNRDKVNFTFQRVWQDNEGNAKQIEEKVADIECAFEKAGWAVNPSQNYVVPYCYADKRNSIVINYNGDLYKCTARDFNTKSREGILTQDGNVVWNAKHEKRMAIKYGNDFCRQCRIYPICHGGCSQMKIEGVDTDSCPKGYDDERIQSIIKGRALFILGQYKKNNGIQ